MVDEALLAAQGRRLRAARGILDEHLDNVYLKLDLLSRYLKLPVVVLGAILLVAFAVVVVIEREALRRIEQQAEEVNGELRDLIREAAAGGLRLETIGVVPFAAGVIFGTWGSLTPRALVGRNVCARDRSFGVGGTPHPHCPMYAGGPMRGHSYTRTRDLAPDLHSPNGVRTRVSTFTSHPRDRRTARRDPSASEQDRRRPWLPKADRPGGTEPPVGSARGPSLGEALAPREALALSHSLGAPGASHPLVSQASLHQQPVLGGRGDGNNDVPERA